MNFSNKIQDQFQKAGWSEGRDVSEIYEIEQFQEYPESLKEFLYEYGNLTILDCKPYKSNVRNQLEILPEVSFLLTKDDDSFDYIYDLLRKDIYIYAYFRNDNYYIGSDIDGNVYMINDYCFLISDSLKGGIEKLLLDDWGKGYKQLNEETGVFE